MKKLYSVIMMLLLVMASCSKSKKVYSPIIGEYEFGFVKPERIPFGVLSFNSDGTVDGVRDGVGIKEEKIFTYEFNSDSILTFYRSFQGDITETIFVIQSESSDSILLKMKSKIKRVGAGAPAWIKNNTNEVSISEYDENSDSILVIAFLKKK